MRSTRSLPLLFSAVLLLFPALPSQAGEKSLTLEQPQFTPFEAGSFEVAFDSAVLFGIRNRNGYVVAPQMISVLWQPFPRFETWWLPDAVSVGVFGIAMPVVNGPESFYGGGGLASRCRWLPEGWPVAFVVDSRMAAGAIDSRGAREGQGQDFCFALHLGGALEWAPTERITIRGGILWQHLSNADLSEPETPNTGLDAIGPQIGFSYLF